ncbi:hypothetical protein [Chitinophaga vietnamensis]|uniref:hypothetical protein n=1 Tax=Chitinophaga vietnamensis TaxID=2593957 RepID=UPI001177431E|nr:hypothetical protein [Chitinophaga vietnamensis]
MSRKLEFTKALYLLDAQRSEEAVILLNTILAESKEEDDLVYVVRTSTVLGEHYFNTGDIAAARQCLEMATSAEVDEDEADILDEEISRAKTLLKNIV